MTQPAVAVHSDLREHVHPAADRRTALPAGETPPRPAAASQLS